MTKKQLERFIKTRNTAYFHTNLQFQSDAEECGIKMADLGEANKDGHDYVWSTPFGTLREHRGMLSLEAKDKRAA